jgi:hypothetical protein
MVRKCYLTALSFLVAVFFLAAAAQAATIFFELAGETNIAPGDLDLEFDLGITTEFSLDVYMQIGDDEDNDGLYTAFHKIFIDDNAVLNFDETAGGMILNEDLWDPSLSTLEINGATGVAEMAPTDYWDSGQLSGELLLETVTFTLDGTGTADLTMDFWDPIDGGNFLTWPDGSGDVDSLISFDGATVTVSPANADPVPIPGVLLLLLLD